MYIVGTSGHIDHGKTSLIRALTGIDCDRLPEEKTREMTIDIGFASIDYPKFGTVSIIDVPGHERFIRNMVVGAWGIDLALLVIAVDDGWMPQTEDHYRVLSLLGVERIIAVINKIDIADLEMIDFVTAEVKEKLAGTRYAESDIVTVSSKNGQGIEKLRDTILKNLKMLQRTKDAYKPYLFVDRVFASKGYGTVVTGTLKNGSFRENDEVTVLPQRTAVRIKKIESHKQALSEGMPSQRTALNLSGLSTDDIKRGHIVVKDRFFTASTEVIAKIELLERKKDIKNNTGIEMLIGTSGLKGKLIFLDSGKGAHPVFPARIRFEHEWFFYPGEPFILTHPGGFRIIGGGNILMPSYKSGPGSKPAASHLQVFSGYSREEIILFTILVNRYIKRAALYSIFSENEKTMDAYIAALLDKKKIIPAGDFLTGQGFFDEAKDSIYKKIRQTAGLNLKEISDMTGIGQDLCAVLARVIMQEQAVIEDDGKYFMAESMTQESLSSDKKRVLDMVLKKNIEGIELEKLDDDIIKKNIKELLKLKFLISLDGNIIFHKDVYEDLKQKVMVLFSSRDKISIPEAKDATALSRKYIIPLLNRVEADGLIKRIGDFRIKA